MESSVVSHFYGADPSFAIAGGGNTPSNRATASSSRAAGPPSPTSRRTASWRWIATRWTRPPRSQQRYRRTRGPVRTPSRGAIHPERASAPVECVPQPHARDPRRPHPRHRGQHDHLRAGRRGTHKALLRRQRPLAPLRHPSRAPGRRACGHQKPPANAAEEAYTAAPRASSARSSATSKAAPTCPRPDLLLKDELATA